MTTISNNILSIIIYFLRDIASQTTDQLQNLKTQNVFARTY